MANKYFTQLTQLAAGSVASGDALAIEDIDAAETKYITAADLRTYMTGGGSFALPMGGRLTTETGVGVSTADRAAQGSVYWTPYGTNASWVRVWNGSAWVIFNQTSDLTLTLNASNHLSGSVYDVYLFSNSGTLTIATSPAWTSTTSRGTGAATAEVENYQGTYVNKNTMTLKNGSTTYSSITARYCTLVGTIYCSANAQTDDGESKRYVWNMYNRVPRVVYCGVSASHTYTSTIRAYNGNTTIGQARFAFVDGLPEDMPMNVNLWANYTSAASGANILGIGLDSVAAYYGNVGYCYVNGTVTTFVNVGNVVRDWSIGYHYIQALETGSATSHTLSDINLTGYKWT